MKHRKEGIVCPWCPPVNGEGVLIHKCKHNPFVLMDRVNELEKKLNDSNDIIDYLKELKILINNL